MARPKEFDPAEVLDSALDVFWRQGYEATSVQDLVDHMGINRGSLYDTFGDKHRLYLAALDRYCDRTATALTDLLRRPGPVREVLSDTFQQLITKSAEDRFGRGCLITNSAVELSSHCEETSERVCRVMTRVEQAFQELIERGLASGEITPDHDPKKLARFYVTCLQGLVVVGKARSCRDTLQDAVSVALSALD